MWPSSPSFRHFGSVPCPSGAGCELPYCIFLHDTTKSQPAAAVASTVTKAPIEGPAVKRLKLDNNATQLDDEPNGQPGAIVQPQVFTGSIASKKASPGPQETKQGSTLPETASSIPKPVDLPRTATKPVSPPPKRLDETTPSKHEVEVPLKPRKLQKEPATFARRLTFLQALHKFMTPLNDKVARAVKPETKALHLGKNQLNKMVVDEEERVAIDHASVYENVLKQRLVALKKTTIEDWVKARREAAAKEKGEAPKAPPKKRVDTGLTPKDEVIFLSILTAPQESLSAHGFVTKEPTEAELQETDATQTSADFWEECDRCKSRFQVFPDRREEDGALTTGGKCQHHWGKRIFGRKVKGQDPEPTRFSCCNEPLGTPGCTTLDTHVYKISDARRMSLLMPFVETPENDKVGPHAAVCFDCEMGYTTYGLEILRLTVVSWPSHKPLVDVLVRPLGHVLDLNTRFSGVTADQFLNAKPYDPANPKPIRKDLRIVESPYAARSLFLSHVSPTTPVLGHALENDLNVIRLIHPTIVDSIILFPAPGGLPYRHGLKKLAKWHLNLDIQQGGAAGHDSYEDARTTGELIRAKIAEKWRKMKEEGWTIRDDGVYPPMPEGETPPQEIAPTAPSMVGMPSSAVLEGKNAEKRDLETFKEGNAESDEPPSKKRA